MARAGFLGEHSHALQTGQLVRECPPPNPNGVLTVYIPSRIVDGSHQFTTWCLFYLAGNTLVGAITGT